MTFDKSERARQQLSWADEYTEDQLLPTGIQLRSDFALLNVTADVRDHANWYFDKSRAIAWHQHANHALSSQVACINFLMPLATRPDLLARVIGRAIGREARMLPVEKGPQEQDWYVAFEWMGHSDYLGEWRNGAAVRGQNVTSTDAMVQFDCGEGRETLLIEWKYTERYGAPSPAWTKGNPTRFGRYQERAFYPNGPIRSDLGLTVEDFFFEPVYQMFRQQMLAWQMQKASEDGTKRVRVLHISPKDNVALHKITAPALLSRGTDVFEAFRGVLVEPDAFIPCTTEDLFVPLLLEAGHDESTQAWVDDLRRRYPFLSGPVSEMNA